MDGFTESLNISVSAALILCELTLKLRKSEVSWQLTEQEKLEKRLDWTKKSINSIEGILERYHRQDLNLQSIKVERTRNERGEIQKVEKNY